MAGDWFLDAGDRHSRSCVKPARSLPLGAVFRGTDRHCLRPAFLASVVALAARKDPGSRQPVGRCGARVLDSGLRHGTAAEPYLAASVDAVADARLVRLRLRG